MKAVVITGVGGAEVLEVRERPAPEPRGALLRVRVRACALNRADIMQCRGNYPAPPGAPSDVPGLEYAGEIDALGPDVQGPWKVGDRVFGIVGGGGQAEQLLVHERLAVAFPSNLDFVEAAAVPEAFITAHDALLARGRARPGERVLVHAAGSGVGTAAVQIAHAMGCSVFGTSRTAAKLERARALGLDHGVGSSEEDFAAAVLEKTSHEGVHVALDLLGGPALAGNLKALAPRGRLVLAGLLAGASAPLDLGLVMRKRLSIVGTVLRARPLEEKIAAARRFAAAVVPWLARGAVRPVVDSCFAFEEVHAAHARLASNEVFGKVVLRC